jgi:hypothetical protein
MTITKQIDELTKEEFSFWENGNILIFDSYHLFSRENTRKRTWNKVKVWERLSGRNTNMLFEYVPLTEEIRQEVLQEYIKTLKVMTWVEYKSK